jgi:predicted nucleic acid-binding protein
VTLVRTANADLLRATNLAIDLGHPLKDCIYLALAMELGCDLVTADARFAAKAREVWAGVRVLETAGLAAGD